MTKNDIFFKILFAIEVALLPAVMASYIMIDQSWVVGMFIAGVLVVKIWMELFKNKEMRSHAIINAIGNVLTISSLVIFFTVYGYINLVLCVFVVIMAVLMNLLKVVMYGANIPEMIEAVDSCYMLFECLALIALTFLVFYDLVTNIALFALLLTSAVSVLYRLLHICKYNDVFGKIKNLFRRK